MATIRKIIVVLLLCSTFFVSPVWGKDIIQNTERGDPKYIEWKPVCRHKALYWASMVGEHHPVRIVYGRWDGIPHAQPEVKVGDKWYLFRVIANQEVILMDTLEGFKAISRVTYLESAFFQYMIMKNWSVWVNGDYAVGVDIPF